MTRTEAIDLLDNLIGMVDDNHDSDYDTALKMGIQALEQEPKTGHWVEKDGFDGDVYYDCSECGESWTTIEGTPWQNGMDYCPNCGCRMVEPTCDTCEYNTAAFNPCNACKDKSEYKPQEEGEKWINFADVLIPIIDEEGRYCLECEKAEQEPILDKIRAEIEQIADEEQKHDEKWAIGLRYAVKIIDKYRNEVNE